MSAEFDWVMLGDIEEGRGTLGLDMPVVVYRLFAFTMRQILEEKYGLGEAASLFRAAGYLAGKSFAKNALDCSGDLDFFVNNLQQTLKDLNIGLMRLEHVDMENLNFTLTVSEDLDCSGLPITGDTVCDYDEGLIAGILEMYTGKPFSVKEIDCWSTGARTCRFQAKPQ